MSLWTLRKGLVLLAQLNLDYFQPYSNTVTYGLYFNNQTCQCVLWLIMDVHLSPLLPVRNHKALQWSTEERMTKAFMIKFKPGKALGWIPVSYLILWVKIHGEKKLCRCHVGNRTIAVTKPRQTLWAWNVWTPSSVVTVYVPINVFKGVCKSCHFQKKHFNLSMYFVL